MQITVKYTVALQLLTTCALYPNQKITSNFLASKIGSDAVIIRQVMLDLKKADYISCKPGPGGTTLNVDLNNITLYDIYTAVADIKESIIKFYNLPNNATSTEKAFLNVTRNYFEAYKINMFNEMKKISIQQICNEMIANM